MANTTSSVVGRYSECVVIIMASNNFALNDS